MKLSKKFSLAIALVVVLTIGVITYAFANNIKIGKVDNNVRLVKVEGELSDIYETIDQLKQTATGIIEVNILETETIVYGDVPFTISKAKVLSSLKGKISEGQEIKLIETGGKYTLSGENPKEVKGEEVEIAFEGIRVMQPGEHLVLFVKEFVGPQIQGAFVPLGIYQGKFKVEKDDYVKQQAPFEHKLKDYTSPIKLKEFKDKLKND